MIWRAQDHVCGGIRRRLHHLGILTVRSSEGFGGLTRGGCGLARDFRSSIVAFPIFQRKSPSVKVIYHVKAAIFGDIEMIRPRPGISSDISPLQDTNPAKSTILAAKRWR